MNWFWESMIFGALWSFWHFPLIFIEGTYQAGLTVNPLYVVNFMQEKIAMTPETKCVETLVVTAATVIIVARNRDLFLEKRHVGRLLESVSKEQTAAQCPRARHY